VLWLGFRLNVRVSVSISIRVRVRHMQILTSPLTLL